MTRFLARLIGRMPVGWLQLVHNKGRLAAAVAGVAFAIVLVLVQLGISGSMNRTIQASYFLYDADIMISAEDANTISEGGNVARQWLFHALAVDGVASGTGLFLANIEWSEIDGDTTLATSGIDIQRLDYFAPEIAAAAGPIRLPDVALLDSRSRGQDPDRLAEISPQSPLRIELGGRRVMIADTFEGSTSFSADGNLIVSDQTFLRLFPQRVSGAPDHILLKTDPGVPPVLVVDRLRQALPGYLRIRTLEQAAADDQNYQNTERPTGLIFGFGVVMGILVGLVIVYQILATDVADHMGEYATFKAMGYGSGFFFGVVFEEAVVLAILGFIPGVIISWGLYNLLEALTALPMVLEPGTATMVFLGTLFACTVSGAFATRKLNAADPADLF